MDFNDPLTQWFFRVHANLPRQGPGSEAASLEALSHCSGLPEAPKILDVGCGPGMQTRHLAKACPRAQITAVDFYGPFLEQLRERAALEGLDRQISTVLADMKTLEYPPASFDLIWCEGAVYLMGVEEALKAWRPWLRPGGALALTEAVWFKQDPPASVQACWAQYPEIRDLQTNLKRFDNAGFEVLHHFALPESTWWDDYYNPLAQQLAKLQAEFGQDPLAAQVFAECQAEIECYRDYSEYYGYVFFVARPC